MCELELICGQYSRVGEYPADDLGEFETAKRFAKKCINAATLGHFIRKADAVACQKNDRCFKLARPQIHGELNSAFARHELIGDENVKSLRIGNDVHCLVIVERSFDFVAKTAQHLFGEASDFDFVVNKQYPALATTWREAHGDRVTGFRLSSWQQNCEGSALPCAAVYRNGPLVAGDDLTRNGETETSSFTFRFCCEERLECPLLRFGIHTDAVVCNAQAHEAARLAFGRERRLRFVEVLDIDVELKFATTVAHGITGVDAEIHDDLM